MQTNKPLTKKEMPVNTTTPRSKNYERKFKTLAKFKSAWVSKSKEKYVSNLELLLVLNSLSSRAGRSRLNQNLIQSAKNNHKLSDATKWKLFLIFEKDFYFSKKEFLEIVENFIFEHDWDLVCPHVSKEVERIVKCFFDNTTGIDCGWKDFERYVLTPLLFCN
jgi:hypothetical protein